MTDASAGGSDDAVAVLGAGLRLPGDVTTVDGLWDVLVRGVDAVGPVPAERWDPTAWGTPGNGGFLRDPFRFDAAFFGISPREAADMDPVQRMLLELAWEALEASGRAPDGLERSRTGVYVGVGLSDWSRRHFGSDDPERIGPFSGTGSFPSVAAGRIAYALGLRGPALAVDTACSSSLVAVHLAVQALRQGQIDLALAGGASLLLSPVPSLYFSRLGVLSPDGRCRAFDAAAAGYGRGEGGALVVLARLADARASGWPILAVIRGCAVNQDGRTSGLTAPSGAAQQAVVRAALADAGAPTEDVVYVEAHGTGTPLGDPIELDALRAVFLPRPSPLHVGSAKTNFGHLEAASGILGLLKAALVLRHRRVPPHLHLAHPNPRLRLDGLSVDTTPTDVPAGLAGVSSFGLSGTNAHVVLGPAPEVPVAVDAPGTVVIPLSSRSPEGLEALAEQMARAIASTPAPLAAVASTLARRAALPHRLAVVGATREAVARALGGPRAGATGAVVRGRAPRRPAPVAFLFGGQGTQVLGMGRGLSAAEPVFAAALREVAAAVDAATGERALLDVAWTDSVALGDTAWTQPALFALQVALASFWRSRGVEPEVLVGHSIGELSAAVVAGALGVEDGARLAVARGRCLAALPRDGGMLAIPAAEALVRERLGDAPIDVAAVNGPAETVVSGRLVDLDAVRPRFAGLELRPLRVSHAFHSRWMEPALDAFEAAVRGVALSPPRVQLISAVDGAPLADRALDSAFWRRQVREPVRFADAVRAAWAEGARVFLELSPRGVLSERAAATLPGEATVVPTLGSPDGEPEAFARAAARLWVDGQPYRFPAGPFAFGLPPTPFGGDRHLLPDPARTPPRAPTPVVAPLGARDAVLEALRATLGLAPDEPIDASAPLFDLGLDSVTAVDLRNRLQERLARSLPTTVALDHPSVDRLVAHLEGVSPPVPGLPAPEAGTPIAIVGLSLRLPAGITTEDGLWALLWSGGSAIGEVPPERFDPRTLGGAPRRGGFVTGLEVFDPAAFGLLEREALALDPQQRMLLEGTWDALVDAGLGARPEGHGTGVWVGIEPGDYASRFPPGSDPYAVTGNQPSMASGRLSYVFGFDGPSLSVDTACSSGLVALAGAVEALRAGRCTRAVVGAVNAVTGPEATLALASLNALSPRGACAAFDARADGYVRSEGCVVLVLEPLAAALAAGRRPWGVIAGIAVNHDGASAGLTVPNGPAQEAVVRAALADAGVPPEAVDAVECHGTGTALGDPIEVGALTRVFAGRSADRPLWLGAAKANLGHTETAAGLVGVAKALLMLRHGGVPPVAGLETPNPALPLFGHPALRLPKAPVEAHLRTVGVSAFGLGGTNAHVLITAAPTLPHVATASGRAPGARCWVDHPSVVATPPRWRIEEVPFTPALRPARPVPPVAVVGGGEAGTALAARLGGRCVPVEGLAAARPRTVVDLSALDPLPGTVPQRARRRFLAHLALLGALPADAPVDVLLVSRGGDGDPSVAPLFGLSATVAVEAPHVRHLHVDLGPDTDPVGAVEIAARCDLDGLAAVRDGRWTVRTLVRDAAPPVALAPPGPVAVAGGTGAVGRRLVADLVEAGIGPVVVIARRAAEGLPDGVRSLAVALDDRGAAAALRDGWAALGLPAPAWFVHAAAVNEDAPLAGVSAALVDRVFAVTLDGALALREAFPAARALWVSSAAAVVGNPGQAAYAGAHAALAALVRDGDTLVRLGPVDGEGLAAGRDWGALGVVPIRPRALLRSCLGGGLVLDVDWARWASAVPRIPRVVRDLVPVPVAAAPRSPAVVVPETVARVMGAALAPERGFFDAGMDSILAVALARELSAALGRPVAPTAVFDHPSVGRLVAFLEGGVRHAPAVSVAEPGERIAIVGVSLRMPGGATDLASFWALLASGRDPLGPVPPERWDAGRWPALAGAEGGWLDWDQVRSFDADFFGISAREADALDPQHRLLLEGSVEAIERARIPLDALAETPTAVFFGVGESGYLDRFQRPGEPRYADLHAGTGNLPAFASGRVAHALGLRGPTLTLHTACSSTLVAVHLGCRALLDGEADVALVGGVHLALSPEHALYLTRLGALSPTGRCRTFDASADGYARAEGCGVFVLRRLADARAAGSPVLAVIEGSAVGHDGAASGLTVPNGPAQAAVIGRALAAAGVAPDDVSYVEAHGTGTPLGDPIEVGALASVFGARPAERPLHLGAVKAQVGHAELAAGAASLAKVVAMLVHRRIPPHLHLREPNPALALADRHYVVDTAEGPWTSPDGVLRAGVSSFGLSGTNAHLVVVQGDPPALAPAPAPGPVLLPLAARADRSLVAGGAALAGALRAGLPLADAAWSAFTTRSAGSRRAFVVAATAEDAARACESVEPTGPAPGPVVFLFAGQGTQSPGMGRGLERFPVVRDTFDEARAVLGPALFDAWGDERVHHTRTTQPALVVLEVALARWWASVGVVPDAVLGHSVGHFAAAVTAGVLSFADALSLVDARARLLAALPADAGAMFAVEAPEDVVAAALAGRPDAALAAVNHPTGCTISGAVAAVEAVAAALAAAGFRCTRLAVSHAFHSPLVEPMLGAFEAEVAKVTLRPATLPVVSNLDGRWATDEALLRPAAWAELVRAPVRFRAGLETLGALAPAVAIELGPHPALLAMARATLPALPHAVPSLVRGQDPAECVLRAAGRVWATGRALRPAGLFPEPRTAVDLPVTVFDRRVHWLPGPEFPGAAPVGEDWLVEEDFAPVTLAGAAAPCTVSGEGPLAVRLRARASPGGPGVHVVESDTLDAVEAVLDRVRGGGTAVFVTVGATTGASPRLAAVHGLLRALAVEDPARAPRWLDADADADPEAVLAAVAAGASDLRVRASGAEQRVLRRARFVAAEPSPLPVVLVTGGLGGVGHAVARWLLERGCAGLVLVGRSPPSAGVSAWLSAVGVPVVVVTGDVADASVVDRAVTVAEGLAPGPIGVIHAAGALADASLDRVTAGDLRTALAGKVGGAWNLHDRVRAPAFFVLFGAGAGLIGAPGQSAYAAANAALVGLARRRAAEGKPAVVVDWGAWDGVGMAARLEPALRARRAERGLGVVPVAAGLEVLGHLLAHPGAQIGVLPTDWPRYVAAVHGGHPPPLLAALVPPAGVAPPAPPPSRSERARLAASVGVERTTGARALVEREVRRILRRPPDQPLDAAMPLFGYGLDSLMAIELKNALADLGFDVPVARILADPTLVELGRAVEAALPAPDAPPPGPVAAPTSPIPVFLVAFVLGALFVVVGYLGTAWLAGFSDDPSPPADAPAPSR